MALPPSHILLASSVPCVVDIILTIERGVRTGHELSKCKRVDAGDFIEFGTLAEEIKSLRLVLPEELFLYLCKNTKNMALHGIRSRERGGRRSVCVPPTQCPPMAYIECVMGVVKAGHGALVMFNVTSNVLS